MAKSQVQFTQDNEYYTPREFVAKFGEFDYDPATTIGKAKELGIPNYDTVETNGLVQDWTPYKRIWINPPFTRKYEFLKKAWETYLKAQNEIYFLIPTDSLTTAKFHKSIGGGKIYVPNGRINFESGLGKKGTSPAFGSVVIKLQSYWEIELIDR